LFDAPTVVEAAKGTIAAAGLEDRVTRVGGDFFVSVPAGGDAYLLSHVLHDWDVESCHTILRNCRDAMNPGGRILIVEMVLPPGAEPHPGKVLDLIMLSLPGGRERTAEEYAELVAPVGLRVARVVPTTSPVSVVEVVPV
jgi:predicted O-methyltransferase YrrM